jgi:hypothetical protein
LASVAEHFLDRRRRERVSRLRIVPLESLELAFDNGA